MSDPRSVRVMSHRNCTERVFCGRRGLCCSWIRSGWVVPEDGGEVLPLLTLEYNSSPTISLSPLFGYTSKSAGIPSTSSQRFSSYVRSCI